MTKTTAAIHGHKRATRLLALAAIAMAALPLRADGPGAEAGAHPRHPHVEAGHDLFGVDEGDAFGRGYALHAAGRYAQARAAFEQAIAEGHDESVALYDIACGHALEGDVELAFQRLEEAIDAGFDEPRILRRDEDLAPLRRQARERFEQVVRKAEAIEGKGDRIGALRRLDRLERSASPSPEQLHAVGSELIELGELAAATRALERATSLSGDEQSSSWYNLACARALSGSAEPALDALSRAVEAGYGDDRHMHQDEDLDALRPLPRYREIEARAALVSVERFTDVARSGEWPAAIRKLEERAAAEPGSGVVWFSLGWGRHASGDWGKASAAFAKAAELGHRAGTSHYNVACAEARQGHADAAFAALERSEGAGFHVKGRAWHDEDLVGLRSDARFERYRNAKLHREGLQGIRGTGGLRGLMSWLLGTALPRLTS